MSETSMCATVKTPNQEQQAAITRVSKIDDGDYKSFDIPVRIEDDDVIANVDSGCTGILISQDYVRKSQLPTHSGVRKRLEFADGSTTYTSKYVSVPVRIGVTTQKIEFLMAPITTDILLGLRWLKKFNPRIDWTSGNLMLDDGNVVRVVQKNQRSEPVKVTSTVETVEFMSETRLLKDIVRGGTCFRIFVQDADTLLESLQKIDSSADSVPGDYTDLIKKYRDVMPDTLPPVDTLRRREHAIEHPIRLHEDAKPYVQSIYHLSEFELAELRRQLEELITAGHIRPSSSPWGAPVLFVKKKGSTKLRMCIDFRKLNAMTIKDATPLVLPDEMRHRLAGAKFFSALDLTQGYNQITIKQEDIEKTAFRTRYGHFEWTVMPFGLCNAPATFIRWMNAVLGDLMDVCVVVYMDDILIYSKTAEDHVRHLDQVFARLREHQVYVNPNKSTFGKDSVEFLGHIFDAEGIRIKDEYRQAVLEWPPLTDKADVHQFLGLVNYFKNWIDGYAEICAPLNNLRKKDKKWEWNVNHESAALILKHALVTSPVLHYFRPDLETRVHSDSSAFAVGGWIGQIDEFGNEHPIVFWSRKMLDRELNYSVYEQELLGLVEMLRVGRPYVDGISFIAQTDHRALQWLQTQTKLSKRQASWLERLQALDMRIEYVPGKTNHVADILSRRPDYAPNCPKCRARIYPETEPVRTIQVYHAGDIKEHIRAHLEDDLEYERIRDAIATTPRSKKISKFKIRDGLLMRDGCLYVPESVIRQELLAAHHDHHHPGWNRTYAAIRRKFFWPGLDKDCRSWVVSCDTCQRNKTGDQATGMLHPLPVPEARFTDIGMDFFEPPYPVDGCDHLLLAIDRLTKLLRIIPCKKSDTAADIAERFIASVFRYQGLPDRIVSDRGSIWTSTFWAALCEKLSITRQLSTAHHQQTDGQAERAIGVAKAMLRSYIGSVKSERTWLAAIPTTTQPLRRSLDPDHDAALLRSLYSTRTGRSHLRQP